MERSMGGQAGFGQGLPVGMAPLGGFPSSSGRDPLVGHTFSDSNSELNNHPGSSLLLVQEPVMTDEQVETLRRQISVYATICGQLVELHKSTMAHQANLLAGIQGGQRPPYDSGMAAQAFRSASRHRWTPSQVQLQILENLFEQGNGTPSKKQIKDITTELSQHGHISESNVYNWFQNRKARAKRKKQMLTPKDGDSDVDSDEDESTSEKRGRLDKNGQENQQMGLMNFEGNFPFSEQKSHMTNSTQEDHNTSNSYVVLIDGKPWEVPATVLDVKGSFGETATLLDSGMNIVPMDENGFSIQPLRAGENYSLKRLDKNPRGVSTMKSEGIMNDNPSCTYFSLS